MPNNSHQAKVTTIASFPVNYFLENLAVRSDNSLLVTVLNHKQLWFVPASAGEPVQPILLKEFDLPAMGIVEIEPEVFVVVTSNLWKVGPSYLLRLDLRNWKPGQAVDIRTVLEMPSTARGLNGACMIAPGVMLVADSFAGLIWRVDFAPGASEASARVWQEHACMSSNPTGPMPDQPGINGLAYAERSQTLYFTSTAQQLLMRVRVDPASHEPASQPEFVADGMMGDDLCLDEDAGVAYIATHRQNTIDRAHLEPGPKGRARHSVAGEPFTEVLLGPTSGRWGRLAGQQGRVAYFLTDGGIKAPMPDGSLREARVLRVSF